MERGLHPADRVADYRARGWWAGQTLDQLFAEQVRARSGELAARLHEHGMSRGDVIGVQLPNTIELVEVYLAAWSLGVVVTPLAMQYREHEILAMASQSGLSVYLTVSGFGSRRPAEEVAALRERLPALRQVLVYEVAPASVAEKVAENPAGPVQVLLPTPATAADRELVETLRHDDPNDANDPVTICWTSGTESEPKGVPRCHDDWLAVAVGTVDAPRVVVDDVLLNPFPMINMAGISGLFLPWLRTGCVLVQHHPFDLATFLGQVQTERVTYTVAPPALLWLLLQNTELLAGVDLSSLTRIGSGSAPLQPAMVRGWQERGIAVINFFGSNEGVGLLSGPEDFPDPTQRARYFPRYGADGVTWSSRYAQCTRTRLVDLGTGEDVDTPGSSGVLHLQGPTVFAGYLASSHAPSPFDAQGYLVSGDVFEIAGDDGQFLRYVDRARDVVVRGGMKIAPAELESLIGEHPAVADVAVVGDPDQVLGERVAAVVVLRPAQSLTLAGLVDFLRERRIASYKLPERLEVRDELPRNPVGKVLKRELRASS